MFQGCWNCGRPAEQDTETCAVCEKAVYCDFFCLLKDSKRHAKLCLNNNQTKQYDRKKDSFTRDNTKEDTDSQTCFVEKSSLCQEGTNANKLSIKLCDTNKENASVYSDMTNTSNPMRSPELSPHSAFMKHKLKINTKTLLVDITKDKSKMLAKKAKKLDEFIPRSPLTLSDFSSFMPPFSPCLETKIREKKGKKQLNKSLITTQTLDSNEKLITQNVGKGEFIECKIDFNKKETDCEIRSTNETVSRAKQMKKMKIKYLKQRKQFSKRNKASNASIINKPYFSKSKRQSRLAKRVLFRNKIVDEEHKSNIKKTVNKCEKVAIKLDSSKINQNDSQLRENTIENIESTNTIIETEEDECTAYSNEDTDDMIKTCKDNKQMDIDKIFTDYKNKISLVSGLVSKRKTYPLKKNSPIGERKKRKGKKEIKADQNQQNEINSEEHKLIESDLQNEEEFPRKRKMLIDSLNPSCPTPIQMTKPDNEHKSDKKSAKKFSQSVKDKINDEKHELLETNSFSEEERKREKNNPPENFPKPQIKNKELQFRNGDILKHSYCEKVNPEKGKIPKESCSEKEFLKNGNQPNCSLQSQMKFKKLNRRNIKIKKKCDYEQNIFENEDPHDILPKPQNKRKKSHLRNQMIQKNSYSYNGEEENIDRFIQEDSLEPAIKCKKIHEKNLKIPKIMKRSTTSKEEQGNIKRNKTEKDLDISCHESINMETDIFTFTDSTNEVDLESLDEMRKKRMNKLDEEFGDFYDKYNDHEIDYYELQRNLVIVNEISIDYKEFLRNKMFAEKRKRSLKNKSDISSFFITTKLAMGQIKTFVEKQFQLISIFGTYPHSFEPCLQAEHCSMEVFSHCRWCCRLYNNAGCVQHRFQVTVAGQVTDMEWLLFMQDMPGDEEDETGLEMVGINYSCKPCQVRLDTVDNISDFRLFS